MSRAIRPLIWLAFLAGLAFLLVQRMRQQAFPSSLVVPGNLHVEHFRSAKRHLRRVYADMQYTFYCDCPYAHGKINLGACAFKSQDPHLMQRAQRVEWEHIVPAAVFGGNLAAWRFGHPQCVRKGRKYRGRRCARKASEEFRHMEADLYNLVPSVGEINAARGRLPIAMQEEKATKVYGDCMTSIGPSSLQPREKIRGFIARVYLYMDAAYPGNGIIKDARERQIFTEWHRRYPPDAHERLRARRIERIQKNSNPWIGT